MNRPKAALLLPVLLAGCGSLDFEVDRAIPEQRVEGSLVSALVGGLLPNPVPLDVDIERETEAMDAGPASAVRLHRLAFEITDTAQPSGDDDDFDFVDSVEVFVESGRMDTSLPRIRVAALEPVPRAATSIALDPEPGVDLLPYVEEGAVLTSEARGSPPPDDVTFDGEVTLLVEVL